MKKIILAFIICLSCNGFIFAENSATPQDQGLAGEIFGQPIPAGNYDFVARVAMIFNAPWGGVTSTQEELKKRIETELLMSYEAFQRNIQVSDQEIDDEITKTLKDHKVSFDWQKDGPAYAKWVKDTMGAPVEVFTNQMRHLIQLRKLQQQILDSITPAVTEEEAFQEFLNEYNTLSVELVEFENLDEARKFYNSVKKSPKLWEKRKAKNPKEFKRPGFVALEFLMYMWKFPKDAAYKMLDMKVGSFYQPEPIYRGYGVFKILEIRKADEAEFPKRRDSYYEQIRIQKKYEGFNKWLEDFRKKADLKIYKEPPAEWFSPSSSK